MSFRNEELKKEIYPREVKQKTLIRLPKEMEHDIQIIKWTAEDDRLPIHYAFYNSALGQVLIASTAKGICYIAHVEFNEQEMQKDLFRRFSGSTLVKTEACQHADAIPFLNGKSKGQHLVLHLKGTAFQIAVWSKLLYIPCGQVMTYGRLAEQAIQARAIGTAVGQNPIFYLIPCHRMVRSDGTFDRYYWGNDLKKKLLAEEFCATPKSASIGFEL